MRTHLSAIFLDLFQGIPCLHDEVVMELMWGMQRFMHKLVPIEKSELPNEDRVPMSQGLQMLLSRYGFHVSPEMVSLSVTNVFAFACVHGLYVEALREAKV